MNYKKFVMDTLMPLSIPVEFLSYSGKEDTYITFFCYNEQGEFWAENIETATGIYIQVDIWSKTDYTALEEQVKEKMEAAGFNRTTCADYFEPDTRTYHKAVRFVYVN